MGKARLRAAGIALAVLWLGLAARAFELQVLRGDEHRSRIRVVRRVLEVVSPRRGLILDRRGVVLAGNRRTFELYLTPQDVERDPSGLERAAGMLGASLQPDLERVMARIERMIAHLPERRRELRRRGEKRYPWNTGRQVPFEVAYQIEMFPERFPGLCVREGLRREYPQGTLAAHLVGYVGALGKGEYERLMQEEYFAPGLRDAVGEDGVELLMRRGEFMREQIGRRGIEQLMDRELRGSCGVAIRERNLETGGRSIEVLVPADPGSDIVLSLDAAVQREVEAIIDADPHPFIAAVVADIGSGGLLAVASKPRFDPNALVPPVDAEKAAACFRDETSRPLFDRAVSGAYPPGSVFKLVTAWSVLENGVVGPRERIECRGFMFEGVSGYRCWIYRQGGGAHGPIDLAGALESSCNCYFYEAAKRLGITKLEETARALGFGRPVLGLYGESRGNLPSDGRPRRWTVRDTMAASIGQSTVLATPVQVVQMLVWIAGGPGLTLRLDRCASTPPLRPPGFEEILRGMQGVVAGPEGTARLDLLQQARVSGKTGSAQVGGNRPGHAWFAGFAPREAPRWAVVVLVEGGGSGGDVAAPLAGKIFRFLSAP